MVTSDQILVTAIAGLSPIMFSYIFKNIDNRNQSTIRKNVLDEGQKRIDLLNTYYDAQSKFLIPDELAQLKMQLAVELASVKKKVNEMYESQPQTSLHKVNPVQKVFLTFLPVSKWGWVWHVLYYINALFVTFGIVGCFTDANGNFSNEAFSNSMHDQDLVLGLIIFLCSMLLFYILALRNYRQHTKLNNSKVASPVVS
jgi:hypothetical protein